MLEIDGQHNTWTNMFVEMHTCRYLGPRDEERRMPKARPEGPPLWGFLRSKYLFLKDVFKGEILSPEAPVLDPKG